ncbi:diacylglycerol kinase [Rhodococcus sp. 1163]|uniref:diacylglycerol/lipid kinase family protein n=1 Tax=Rhodococcus sp. 1163 TaxID=1905289 RepID=UPI000A074102|nr:diacylglycerol kinase family protein [Rhodococcus sp. 1163]ORI20806.1 diacylglycerol kinase [Rhodococcus sp. 1163]
MSLHHEQHSSPGQRWSARAAFGASIGAVAVLLVFAGARTLTLFAVTVGALVVGVAAFFWFLTSRGVIRWISLAVALFAPIVVVVYLVRAQLLWVVILALGLAALAALCARAALAGGAADAPTPEHTASIPERPFLIMNPRSGGGKVERFDLKKRAEALGAEVVLLEGPETIDVETVARKAVERGADLLGVAGGDGTQALVAGVAAEYDLPFLVISAGTRNHFASDLGLDLADPGRCLDALSDGVELRVDLGTIDGRTFVNNASFGAYAQVVQSPAYRDAKTGTLLQMLPDVIAGHDGARLIAHLGDLEIDGPQAVLVSNGPYRTHDLVGLGHRARLDHGLLGVVTISVSSARQAVGLLRRTRRHGLTQHLSGDITVDADETMIPVGVDGEALMLGTPVRCTIIPLALRVRVPRVRPGVRPSAPAMDWVRLFQLARSQRVGHVR